MIIGPYLRSLTASTLATAVSVSLATSVANDASAQTGPLQSSAAGIEALIAEGRNDEAVVAARDFLRQVTELTGFGVTNAQLISSPASGFGVFEPRPDNVFQSGEPVYAYVELYGYSMTPQASGAVQLVFDVTFTLDTPSGEQMTDSLIPMGDIRLESFSDPIDGYFHLTYRVNGAAGDYILRTHVTDRASGQSAVFTLPVIFETGSPPVEEDK